MAKASGLIVLPDLLRTGQGVPDLGLRQLNYPVVVGGPSVVVLELGLSDQSMQLPSAFRRVRPADLWHRPRPATWDSVRGLCSGAFEVTDALGARVFLALLRHALLPDRRADAALVSTSMRLRDHHLARDLGYFQQLDRAHKRGLDAPVLLDAIYIKGLPKNEVLGLHPERARENTAFRTSRVRPGLPTALPPEDGSGCSLRRAAEWIPVLDGRGFPGDPPHASTPRAEQREKAGFL